MARKADEHGPKSNVIGLRLNNTDLKRIDAHAVKLRERFNGMTVSRSDAMRFLILAALDAAEKTYHEAISAGKSNG